MMVSIPWGNGHNFHIASMLSPFKKSPCLCSCPVRRILAILHSLMEPCTGHVAFL